MEQKKTSTFPQRATNHAALHIIAHYNIAPHNIATIRAIAASKESSPLRYGCQ